MSTFVLKQIDATIDLFTSMIQQGGGTPRYKRNLEWLLKLRARAASKISAASKTQISSTQGVWRGDSEGDDGDDLELLGWRTRLIERADQARQTVSTIHATTTPTSQQINNEVSPNVIDTQGNNNSMRTAEIIVANGQLHLTSPDSTDDLVG
jgi:hypothetical protein